MKIPVFHDDQHGTAIIVGAAVLNGLRVVGKAIGRVKLVVSGAGAAALACVELLVDLGMKRENIWLTDLEGVVFAGRQVLMDPVKARFAQPTEARTLGDIVRRRGRVSGTLGGRCPHPGHGAGPWRRVR